MFDVETKDFCEVEKLQFGDDPISLAVGIWDSGPGDDAEPLIFTDDARCRAWLAAECERNPNFVSRVGGGLEDLMLCLDAAPIIVAYNHNFDMGTLRAYVAVPEHYAFRRELWEQKTIDPFDKIRKRSDIWPALNDVAKANFDDCRKSGKSAQAPDMLRDGDIQHLWEYCWMDVIITKRIYDIKEKTIVPEKLNQLPFALTEVDVAKKIHKREAQLLACGAPTQPTCSSASSPSQLEWLDSSAIETIIQRLSLVE